MRPVARLRRAARKAVSPVLSRIAPELWKEYNELRYWRAKKRAEGELGNDHYKVFYTDHFGLTDDDYRDKVVLDIGCGPRGSLEWATMARRTIGLDPLAKEYLRLGADKHRMEYFDAPSEHIALPDGACDVVCSFNSLDHVDDVGQTLSEIKRVTKAGGRFLLLLEINHAPTPTEPHDIGTDIVDQLAPEFVPHDLKVYVMATNDEGRPLGLYPSLRQGQVYDDPRAVTDKAYLSCRFERN
jgi:SAM-dependent methyltransferase